MRLEEALKLTAYIGERDRAEAGLLSDAILDAFAECGVESAVLLRGIEGFGARHRLQTDRLLTLSEDLPLLAVAVDVPSRIENVLERVRAVCDHGLITLERARLLRGDGARAPVPRGTGANKLTVELGRGQRIGGAPAYLAVVDCLRRHGFDGASVLLGVDGIAQGRRRRGRMLARNADVPLIASGVGDEAGVEGALDELTVMSTPARVMLERVQVCKRDGRLLGLPAPPPEADRAGLPYWQKLVVHTSEHDRHGREPLHGALVRALRSGGAPGATSLRGQWGYHGERPPHGERFLSIRRQVPVLSTVLDTPANCRRWFEIIDAITGETGLVTSEVVPALSVAPTGRGHGPLALARERPPLGF